MTNRLHNRYNPCPISKCVDSLKKISLKQGVKYLLGKKETIFTKWWFRFNLIGMKGKLHHDETFFTKKKYEKHLKLFIVVNWIQVNPTFYSTSKVFQKVSKPNVLRLTVLANARETKKIFVTFSLLTNLTNLQALRMWPLIFIILKKGQSETSYWLEVKNR